MKNSRALLASFILSFCLLFNSCTPDATGLVLPTEEVLVRNVWSVDYFDTQDMTNNFTNSKLLFSSTGTVGYQENGETTPGTWLKTVDASNKELIDLNLNTHDANVARLNQSWILINRTANSMQFEDAGGTGIVFRIKTQ